RLRCPQLEKTKDEDRARAEADEKREEVNVENDVVRIQGSSPLTISWTSSDGRRKRRCVQARQNTDDATCEAMARKRATTASAARGLQFEREDVPPSAKNRARYATKWPRMCCTLRLNYASFQSTDGAIKTAET
ncbi:MAG TPA: hypothetical protein VE269_00205, partial [Gaiellaceae bacterium]|nr:hypothetical protein [Gaiellaceae bacterium]